MDPIFISTPNEEAINAALSVWPELAGRRVRPLLVTAFGDIYIETQEGEVWAAKPIEIEVAKVCNSVQELEKLFSNPEWAEESLITNLVLLANEKGIKREPYQVFAFAPHPCMTGSLDIEHIMPMEVNTWHQLCSQLGGAQQGAPADAEKRRG